ncbi:unnamed protein product [Pleuronectes platessa]|uniref:Uncharacterized protein n=1 Tax=Pleuronectes platessa TaxID=8262 RepID=A0A9N7YVM2_PLEPL|nr:unnamed protein product [Pleuronectes platessa]
MKTLLGEEEEEEEVRTQSKHRTGVRARITASRMTNVRSHMGEGYRDTGGTKAAVTDCDELSPERNLLLPERGEHCFICPGPRDRPSVCLSSYCPSTPRRISPRF